jgi:exopolyphosphatase/guanosine-5'-triphosphate,3'-diphosphate pyrophosphatase
VSAVTPMSTIASGAPVGAPPAETLRTVAVIDIGTNSIRINIAEISPSGEVRSLDALTQPVHLGRDTFATGAIERPTFDAVIGVLKGFQSVMQELGVTRPDQVRAVATSAVREARNSDAFVDRITIATGITVDVIDAAEETRLTYQSVLPYIAGDTRLAATPTLVVEVGGGNTEVLLLRNKDVLFSHNYRFGARRLRQMLEMYHVLDARIRRVMARQVDIIVESLRQNVEGETTPNVLMLGSEARLAAAYLVKDWDARSLVRIPTGALGRFVDDLFSMSVEEIVRKHKLLFPEAETIGPTLLAYVQIARALGARNLIVSKATMRDGILVDMATGGSWSEEFFEQIVRAAIDLGHKYQFDEAHAMQVATLSRNLFEVLRNEHRLESRHGLILYVAAVLHEIGGFVNTQSHHKHSMYLILNSELFGLSQHDLLLVALIARYHRRATPQATHEGYAGLDRESRIIVAKLAAILRLADALDRSHSQRIRDIACSLEPGELIIGIPGVDDLSLEQVALHEKGSMFEDVYGLRLVLRGIQTDAAAPDAL